MSWLSKFIGKRKKEFAKIEREVKDYFDDMTVEQMIDLALTILSAAGNKSGVPLLGQAVYRIIQEKLNDRS